MIEEIKEINKLGYALLGTPRQLRRKKEADCLRIKRTALREFKRIMEESGIRIVISGCGCCGSPSVSMWYKEELIVDDESDFNINMGRKGRV